MSKKRDDSWLESDDKLLIKTVLKHITNGSTQLCAFEEASQKLNRTTAACGFRWNSNLRKNNKEKISLAKKERFKHKNSETELAETPSTLLNKLAQYIADIESVIAIQKEEIDKLNKELALQQPSTVASEDFHSLLEILSKAREIGYLEKAY
ncbi:hypothetical protein EBB07_29095 [Paenibacillaceae bacterium]|nr:hypothetical protein EBB07_29095 [Paenibacillaceae bacterium]